MTIMASSKTSKRGLTFIELMVATVILAVGIVTIYRSYISLVGYSQHIIYRIYANQFLDNKMALIERLFLMEENLPLKQVSSSDSAVVNGHSLHFSYAVSLEALQDINGLYALDVTILWQEGQRRRSMERKTFLVRQKVDESF